MLAVHPDYDRCARQQCMHTFASAPAPRSSGPAGTACPSSLLARLQLCHQPSPVAASRGSSGPGTAGRWVPPELAKELVEREDFVLHHTYEVVPTETRTPPYQTRSMSLLPMFGQAVRLWLFARVYRVVVWVRVSHHAQHRARRQLPHGAPRGICAALLSLSCC